MVYVKSKWIYLNKESKAVLSGLTWKLFHVDENVFDAFVNNDFEALDEDTLEALVNEYLIVSENENEDDFFNRILYEAIFKNELKVTIIPTELCNFRCVYCYENHNMGSMTETEENGVIKFFKRNIRKYERVNVEWFGGEPLLERDKVIKIANSIKQLGRENGVSVIASMTTNGYLLDHETFSELLKANVLYYQITLDGIAAIHDKMRPLVNGKGTFEKIYNNLKELRKTKNNMFKIAIRVNLSKSTVPYLNEFLDMLNKDFGDDPRFTIILETVKDWGGNNECKASDDLLDGIDKIKDNKSVLQSYIDINESISGRICHSLMKNGFAINYNGSVLKCAKAQYENDEIRNENIIGSIDDRGVLKISKPKETKWITPDLRNPKDNCDDCWAKPTCFMSICPLAKIKQVDQKCIFDEIGSNIDDVIEVLIKNGNYSEIKSNNINGRKL